ncbi:MAG: alanine racemase [Novosphingobium sp.]
MPPEIPDYPLRLTIDSDALVANWRALDRLSASAAAAAAVKADAYGLGARRIVPLLRDAGCQTFYVAHWAEAAELLELVPPQSLVVLHGPIDGSDAAFAKASGIRPVINSLHQARLWRDAGGGLCDLMVDTGINRIGLAMGDLGDPLVAGLKVDTLHSHLASADEDSPLNDLQCRRWLEARGLVSHRRAAIANSAGVTLGPDFHGDITRPGLALYGGVPVAALADHISQVAIPQARLIQRRTLQAGDTVGYNATFTASGPTEVGVVSLGYADGYLRCWSNAGAMHAGGNRLRVLGRVSMDMTVIDLGAAPELREGDWLSLDYSLPQAAATSGLSQYELLTALGRRFQR